MQKEQTHTFPFVDILQQATLGNSSTTTPNNSNSVVQSQPQQQQPTVLTSNPITTNTNLNSDSVDLDEIFKFIQQPSTSFDMNIINHQFNSLSDNNSNNMYNNNNTRRQFSADHQQQQQITNQHHHHHHYPNNFHQQQPHTTNNIADYDTFLPEFDVNDQQVFATTPNNNIQQQPHMNINVMPIVDDNNLLEFINNGGYLQAPQGYSYMQATTNPQTNSYPKGYGIFNQGVPFVSEQNSAQPLKPASNQFSDTVTVLNSLPNLKGYPRPHSPLSGSTLSPGSTITPSPSALNGFTFQGIQIPDLIKLVEGFNKPVTEKQIGGRDNTRHPLPRQVIELDVTKLPQDSNPAVISVRPSVMGIDKSTRKNTALAVLGEKPFVKASSHPVERWVAIFDDIVIQFASHNNGQKLRIKFELLDAEKRVVCSIESYGFETITKRGIEKKKERRKTKDKRKRNSDTEEDETDEATIEHVSPAFGFTSGGALVKVMGSGFVSTPLSKCVVRFGDKDAREIHTIKRNYIVCETPESEKAGIVDVSVMFGESLIGGEAKFQYIDPTNTYDLQLMIQHMIGNQNALNNFNADASSFSNKCYDQTMFYSGKVTDECGFTVLHHASARGLFELSQYLVTESVVDIDAKDNYGRTALHWASFASSDLVCLYLINNGADISETDEVGDNLLHIACRYATVEHVQNVLGVLLKHDDKYRTNTNNIYELLTSKNNEGETPLDLAKSMEMDDSVMQLISVFESAAEYCQARLSEYRIHQLKNITLRSGEFNGKTISSLEGENNNLSFDIQLKKDKLVLSIDNGDGNQIRVSIDYKHIAFLILIKPQLKAEITLNTSPLIEFGDANGNWARINNHRYLSSCLSFHLEVKDSTDLDKINKFICDNDLLYPFQTMCFCYRPTIEESTNKLKTLPSSNTTPTTNTVNKVTMISPQVDSINQRQTNIF
ncbi:ankyrin repeat domain-containing protein [Naegleria gruberi]|uniref:Ankyrin repeat domain-containing protein n=1 Tax=Naegleria gruberi TaxID=5762 RepID=D2V0N8_NAEGR|nr:ankyrin repeat domain-containing protein [Naegleria gruberi]EFC49553.1 ankyrin repeat domain-containing protein [Naegleria gruberi]|eukprot:XP_002682297.1 ankyrin repeat domain-containing protein [Naegleria gruberi strain NEG-M]